MTKDKTLIATVDMDDATYLGSGEDGVYWAAAQGKDGWYVTTTVDTNTGAYCGDMTQDDGPYGTESQAFQAGLNAAFEWLVTNDVRGWRTDYKRLDREYRRMVKREGKQTFEPLTPETLTALRSFASCEGRGWKASLLKAWEIASMPGLLHQLRNSHGPSWLVNYRLPKELTAPELAYREQVHSQFHTALAETKQAFGIAEAAFPATCEACGNLENLCICEPPPEDL